MHYGEFVGAYKQISRTFMSEYKNRDNIVKSRLVQWRSQPPIIRIGRPTNVSRARELGYKAKQGVVLARIRVRKGLSKREKARKGRKPSKSGRYFAMSKSFQAIAEERAARKFINCEVINSYYVGEDGTYKFFEAIMADRSHPSVAGYAQYGNALRRRARAFRGLTHAGREHRESIHRG